MEGKFLNLMKNIYKNVQLTLILNDNKLQGFLPKSEKWHDYIFSPLLFNIILEVPANTIS